MLQSKSRMRKSEQGASWIAVLLAILGAVILVGAVSVGIYVKGYNRAVRLDLAAQEAWANVDAQLQRRLDLVPNLVETVKGYAGQEKEIFENIAQARTKYFQSDKVDQKIDASNQLSGLLSRLLVLRETYPELKSNQNFLALQDQLEGTENRIAVARTRYNEAARMLNTYAREVFGSWFARKAGVEPKPLFETTEPARTGPPKVDFSSRSQPGAQPTP
ncbi:MAG: LemA family protein [Phycisphaerales bacterium]